MIGEHLIEASGMLNQCPNLNVLCLNYLLNAFHASRLMKPHGSDVKFTSTFVLVIICQT